MQAFRDQMIEPDLDSDSTLVRRGANAATFLEMAKFADEIEARPLDKLLSELPALVKLSETKFNLARQVIRRRARELTLIEQTQLRMFAEEVSAMGGPAAERIRSIFE